MRTISSFFVGLAIIIVFFSACKDKNNLENSIWKSCGDDCTVTDVIDFRKDKFYFSIKNDSIYNMGSLIGVIDTITYYYGERRLYVKNSTKGCVARYCEQ